ncbi:MAG: hypothetical protein WC441_04795 [Patescibacteria group bacterium]
MSNLKTHLKELDYKFEELENLIAKMDEQDHFANSPDVFIAISDVGVKIDFAKKTIYSNTKETKDEG